MSGYPEESRPNDPRVIEMARGIVTVPAILLIILGLALAVLGGALIAIAPQVPAKLDEVVAQVEADPKKTDDEKKQLREAAEQLKRMAEDGMVRVGGIILLVSGLLAMLGGVKLLTLSGVVFPILGAVAVVTPFTASLCCLAGLPIGIWVIVAATRPVVRSAMEARRLPAPPADPDAQYMR